MISEKLLELQESENIAELLEDEELNKIGLRASQDFLIDEQSRDDWLKSNEEAIKIAKQVMESKATPWPDAANVKYPLITAAVIAFSSRTYPEIVRGDKIVQVGIIGRDEDGSKEERARRISEHMSYQLLVESPNWETDTDKLLHILPLMGLVYRKSYFDPFLGIPATELCLPDKITVNNHIKSIESARRITHQLDLYGNDLIERMRLGIYKEYELSELDGNKFSEDEDPIFETLEQFRYLDLDKDGYKEPYIVTFHKSTQKILRIRACFDLEDVQLNKKGKIIKIVPTQYFTDYHFIRDPSGGFHSLGYGRLLYPINETVNTTINQLLDAGTLSNRQSGFITKQFRSIKGNITLKPGEWKQVDIANGQQLSNSIVPLPVREPSSTLFNLMGTMISAGKELASITDIMQGNQPAQNSPATTVLALLEQGLKDQKAITKRLHRSLTKEFQKLARLNRVYLDEETYFDLFTGENQITRDDYADKKLMIFPSADPSISSDAQRLARAQALMQNIGLPDINKREATIRWLDAMEYNQKEKLLNPLPPPDAPPPPDVQKMIEETALIRAQIHDLMMGRELEAIRIQQNDNMRQAQAAESAARIQKMHDDVINKFGELLVKFTEIEAKFGPQTIDVQPLEAAKEEAAVENTQANLPPEQQVLYEPSDIRAIMAQFQQPAGQNPPQETQPPEVAPAPDQAQPENPEGVIAPQNENQEQPIGA